MPLYSFPANSYSSSSLLWNSCTRTDAFMCSLVLYPRISFKGCCFILIELYPVLESLLFELGSPVPLTSSSLSLEAVGLEIG